MKKLMIALLCLALLVMLALAAQADAAGDTDFVVEDGVLTGYTGLGGNITIPGGVSTCDRSLSPKSWRPSAAAPSMVAPAW